MQWSIQAVSGNMYHIYCSEPDASKSVPPMQGERKRRDKAFLIVRAA